MRALPVLVLLTALAGCATPPPAPVQPAPCPPAPPPVSTFDELLTFAGEIAERPPAERLNQCRQLQQQAHTQPSPELRLRLLLVRSITETCGQRRELNAELDQALTTSDSAQIKSFLRYHQALLARLDREAAKRKALNRRISQTLQQKQETHKRLQSQAGELKALQQKLDALRTIEQSLDETNDDGP